MLPVNHLDDGGHGTGSTNPFLPMLIKKALNHGANLRAKQLLPLPGNPKKTIIIIVFRVRETPLKGFFDERVPFWWYYRLASV